MPAFQCYAFLLHFVPTMHTKTCKESAEFFFFYYCHSRQVTSHLDIRVSAHPLPVAHPVISRFPEIRGFPAALDSSSLIITLSIETVAMEAGDSELIGILGNYILAADTLMPKYGYCCIARSCL